MTNVFDQFDAPASTANAPNVFDQFDPAQRGALGEVATGFKRGVMVDLPSVAGHVLQSGELVGAEPGPISAYGKRLVDESEARGKKPEYTLEPEKHGAITNALAQGAEIIPQVAAPVAAAVAAPETAIGAGAAALAGAVPFALSAGHETLMKARAKGVPEDEALAAARENALAQGALMTAGGAVTGKVLAGGSRAVTGFARAGENAGTRVIGEAADTGMLKPALAAIPEAAAANTTMLAGQAAAAAVIERAHGVDDRSPGEAAAESIPGALGMTALLAPFGFAGAARVSAQKQRVIDTLRDPQADPGARLRAAMDIHRALDEADPQAAQMWDANAADAITAGKPIELDDSFISGRKEFTPDEAPPLSTVDPSRGPLSRAAAMSEHATLPAFPFASEEAARRSLEGRGEAPEGWQFAVERHPSIVNRWAVTLRRAEKEDENARSVEGAVPADTTRAGGENAETAQRDGTRGEAAAPGEEARGAAGAPEEPLSIDALAHAAATSPLNARPEPTPAQQDAGNYAKGHVKLHGLDISIENPAGSIRKGADWQQVMADHYGYIRGTVGRDKDHLDVFIGPNPESKRAFVVDQVDPKTGAFDEHKIIIGADSLKEARDIYKSNYHADWKGMGKVTPTSIDGLKAWFKSGDTKAPFAERAKGATDAAPKGEEQAGGVEQHLGTDAGVPGRGENRHEPAQVGQEGAEAGGGDRAQPGEAQPVEDFHTRSTGELKVFKDEAGARGYLEQRSNRVPGNFAPRETPDGWVLSRQIRERTEAQKANDRRLARERAQIDPARDSLATMIGKLGGVKADELLRDGVDKETLRDFRSRVVGKPAYRTKGGLSIDALAEILDGQGFDLKDEYGAIDATKLRDLIDEELNGTSVYTPEGHERRAALADAEREREEQEASRVPEFEPTDEEMAEADLAPEMVHDAALVARAVEISEDRVERLALQYPSDEAAFMRAVKEMIDEHERGQAAGRGGEEGRGAPQGEARPEKAAEPARGEYQVGGSADSRVAQSARTYGKTETFDLPAASGGGPGFGLRSSGGQLDLFTAGAVPSLPARGRAIFATEIAPAKRGEVRIGYERITNAREAAHVFAAMRKLPREYFAILVLDKDERPIAYLDLFRGAVTQTSVYPQIVTSAVFSTPGAKSVWMAHNHPSGVPEPSIQDRALTRTLNEHLGRDLGVEYRGHVIIGGKKAMEVGDDRGLTNGGETFDIPAAARKFTVPIMEGTVKVGGKLEPGTFNKLELMRRLVQRLSDGHEGLLLLDVQLQPVAYVPMSIAAAQRLRAGDRNLGFGALVQAFAKSGADIAVAYHPEDQTSSHDFRLGLANITNALRGLDFKVFDAVTGNVSYAERNLLPGLMDGPPPGSGKAFFKRDRSDEAGPVDVRNVAARLGVAAKHVDTEAQLPEHLRDQIKAEKAEGDVRGVFDPKTGDVYLVGSNIKSEGEAVLVALHESAHRGLEKLFGEDLRPILDHIFETNEKVQERARAIMAEHGYEQARATEEVLADMALRGQARDLKGWERFVEFIRTWLAKHGFPLKVSDEMAEFIAGAAAEAGKGAPAATRDEAAKFHLAYHGSPHDFDRFELSDRTVGTGEGAKAFGHGLYFSGKKEVAQHYRERLASGYYPEFTKGGHTIKTGADLAEAYFKPGNIVDGYGGRDRVLAFEHRPNGGWAVKVEAIGSKGQAVDRPRWHATFPDNVKLRETLEADGWTHRAPGRVYEVELAPKEHEYLDYDKPYDQQSPEVRRALEKVGIFHEDYAGTAETGESIYHAIGFGRVHDGPYGGDRAASELLAKAGIPGLKFLDSTSRARGEGTHNYVIFDDKHVEVKAKFSRAAATTPSSLMGVAAKLRDGLSDEVRQRDIARGGFRSAMASLDRNLGVADAALQKARKAVDEVPAAQRWDAMHQFQTGGAEAIADPQLRPIFEAWKKNVDERAAKMKSWDEGYLKEVIPHYFSQMWKDPDKAVEFYQRMMTKGPLEGGKSFLKKRAYATYKEGMSWKVYDAEDGVRFFSTEKEARAAAGPNEAVRPPLEPLSNNFVDIAQASLQQMDKFIAMHEFRQWLKEEKGWVRLVRRGDKVPMGYGRVEDPAFRKMAVFPIMDSETGKPGAAAVHYDYLVPELIARDLNNYLSKGLYQFGLWRSLRYAQNLMLSARLGFSAFHAGFTTMDTLVSHTDVGARYLLQGDVPKAIATWGKAVTSPISAPLEGRTLLKQFYGEAAADADTAAVLHFLTEGGARGRMHPTEFNNSWQALKRSWEEGKLKDTAFHLLPAAMEGVMRPIMHYLVPWQKMTARVLLAKFELDRVAAALGQQKGQYAKIVDAMGEDAMRQISYKVVQQVDDRLGQVSYDNLFWNKFAKDIAQASIQSVGWNVGTVNVIFGGAKDAARLFKPEDLLGPLDKGGTVRNATLGRITGRLSYLISLNLTVGMMGAVMNYALTGEEPKDLRDYFFPRTGRKNQDGTDERVSMPSYVKDEYAFSQHPVTTVQHKLHPFFSTIAEMLKNEDFYGTQIVNPEDPWTKVAAQVVTYLGKSVQPYAVQNLQQNLSKGTSPEMAAAPFIGITPAPASVSRTAFEAYVSESYAKAFHTTQTPESAEKAQARRDAIAALRAGKQADLSQFTPHERMSIFTAARTPIQQQRFARLSLQQKISAYERATPEEREQFHLRMLLARDFSTHQMALDPDVRTKAMEIIRAP